VGLKDKGRELMQITNRN